MTSVGEALVEGLSARGVSVVFGIPGVHTIELYRGLAGSGIRHVTPRHEQGAGFMADGYARVSGQPGVAFVITGPGVANILTAMAQARADSVPILVVAGANPETSQAKGQGWLHELPNQLGMVSSVALLAQSVRSPAQLGETLDAAFARLQSGRGGPVHIEVPTDVMPQTAPAIAIPAKTNSRKEIPGIAGAAAQLAQAHRPVILAGGGCKRAGVALQRLAEAIDAPVIQTVNARGLVHGHPLLVPASASLQAVRALIADSDQVLALGTELGPTDYDMFNRGGFPDISNMIRVDIDAAQLARHPAAHNICGDAEQAISALLAALPQIQGQGGAVRSAQTRAAAWQELGAEMQGQVAWLNTLRDTVPKAIMVGDSTQPVYAGNLYYDHDRAGGWFNAATGFGALGFATGAAVGAAIAAPDTPVMCILGDGGLQFSPGELMCAMDEGLDITYLVWNNAAYGEIASSMRAVGVTVIGCDPTPPDMAMLAASCRMPFQSITTDPAALRQAMLMPHHGPRMIEIRAV